MYRKILPVILIVCSPAISLAQATLTASTNNPVIGDTYVSHNCDTAGVTPGGGGAGITWDFSGLTATSKDTISAVACATTPKCSDFPGTSLVSYDPAQSTYSYIATSSTNYSQLGYSSPTTEVVLSSPADVFRYPFTFGTGFSNTVAGNVTYGGSTYHSTVNDSTLCVGYGTLKLPGGATYSNVLMVTNMETYSDSAKLIDTTAILTYNINTFYWYTPGYHTALLTISYIQSISSPIYSKTVAYSERNTAGVPQIVAENGDLQLFPNPVSDELNIRFTGNNEAVQIAILDITGRQVAVIANDKYSGTYQITYNTSSLSKGLYFIRMLSGTQTITRKVEVL